MQPWKSSQLDSSRRLLEMSTLGIRKTSPNDPVVRGDIKNYFTPKNRNPFFAKKMSVKGSGRWRRHPTFGIWDSVSRILGDVFTGRNAMLHALYLVLLLLLNTDVGEEDSWSGRWRKHPTKTILLTHFHVMNLLFKSDRARGGDGRNRQQKTTNYLFCFEENGSIKTMLCKTWSFSNQQVQREEGRWDV